MKEDRRVAEIAKDAKKASRFLARLSADVKNRALLNMADALMERVEPLLEANAKDLEHAQRKGLSKAMVDRLTLNHAILKEMAEGLREVANLSDPVGEVVRMWRRPNGLLVGRMSVPLGVVGIIYESRPNVTVDAVGLCLKSGNAVVLRGGSEAIRSNLAIVQVLRDSLVKEEIPKEAIGIIPVTDRSAIMEMLQREDEIDVIIPRGGEDLIRFVVENSRIPVIKHYKGVCHIFVDVNADIAMAEKVCMNAKVQRPGVCNAMETLLVHKDIAQRFLPLIGKRMREAGVRIRGCPDTVKLIPDASEAVEEDWYAEYLDLVLAIRVVRDLDEAIEHIGRYGSDHTEAIITSDYRRAQRFLREVDSSVVLVNASTRFSDGYQLGLGAEIGISTTKLHAFGPMGVEDLTTKKFIIYGDGHIRG